jgi:hypothetical protein
MTTEPDRLTKLDSFKEKILISKGHSFWRDFQKTNLIFIIYERRRYEPFQLNWSTLIF